MTTTIGNPAPVVLLIDDEQSLAYLIHRYGQASNCQVMNVQLLDEARAIIEHTPPALVVLHVAPQRLDSWEAVRALKADPVTSGFPVVAVCAASTDAARVWEMGADYCLTKPVLYDDFRAVLVASGAIPPSP